MSEIRTRARTREVGSLVVKRVRYTSGELTGEDETEETIRVPFFGNVEIGRVGVTGSITRNLGDFNSVRVEVNFELPCLPELSEAERVYNIAAKFVDERIKTELEDAITSRGPHGKIDRTEETSEEPIRRRISV